MVKLPRLVDPATGAEIRRLQPIRGSLTQKIVPLSYASLELLPEDSVPPRSFVEMYTESGSAGVFRAKAPQDGFGDLTVTCELEHAVTELGDSLVTAELEQETTLHDAFVTLMTYYKGTHWQLQQSFAAPDAVVLQAAYVGAGVVWENSSLLAIQFGPRLAVVGAVECPCSGCRGLLADGDAIGQELVVAVALVRHIGRQRQCGRCLGAVVGQ